MSYNESLRGDSNYPPMSQSDWDRAPWNEIEPPEREFDVYCSQTLSKSTKVQTKDYVDRGDEIDTTDTDWFTEFSENDHYTPLELLDEFRKLIRETIQSYEVDLPMILANPKKTSEVASRIRHLSHLEQECENWVIDEEEIGEE